MNPRALLLASALLTSAVALVRAADTATPAGYWEGSVSLPNRELEIRVELTPGGAAWGGTIDIPLQGFRGYKLDGVKIDGTTVEFAIPGIPGAPRFSGKLSADAKTISGDFTQGGNATTFKLERKAKPAPKPEDETPARGVPGKGLAGHWRGSIKPAPQIELRLGLELAANASGQLEGTVVSLDQGNARLPISNLTEKEGKVRFEVARVNGSFEGELNADGSEIAGNWTQNGNTTPLVYKRLPAAK